MDVWIVAAAAGAGYVAQHCSNLLKGRSDSSPGSPSSVRPESSHVIQGVSRRNNLFEGVMQKKKLDEGSYAGRELPTRDTSTSEVSSTSCEDFAQSNYYDDCNVVSSSSSFPSLLNGKDIQEDKEVVGAGGGIHESESDPTLQSSNAEIGLSYFWTRSRSSLRSRRTDTRFIKPLSALDSCLMAQLYKEHAQVEEYVYTPVSSPCTPTVRPFLVSDGIRIISRTGGESFSLRNGPNSTKEQMEAFPRERGKSFEVPQLPNNGSMKSQRNGREDKSFSYSGGISNDKHNLLQGSSNGAFQFLFGLSIGMMCSLLTNRREVDKLNELLKQTQNLVRDLQDELEMKDSLTVKELATEDYESQDMDDGSFSNKVMPSSTEQEKPTEHCDEQYHGPCAEEESLSKIEAELEAELERLEFNINSSHLEGKSADLFEVDPDFIPDMAEGELRADVFGGKDGVQVYADKDGSDSSTPHSANYAVSPRELSLRLNEVVQTRLEERIRELETALQNSHKKVKNMEAERIYSWRVFPDSEGGSSSNHVSPAARGDHGPDQPVVINLSGEALDAYNESSDEFTKLMESEEDDLPRGVLNTDSQERASTNWEQNREQNQYVNSFSAMKRNLQMAFILDKEEDQSTCLTDLCESRDESDRGDDEMEQWLIKSIVEKARKGSPAVMKFSKDILFPLDSR